MTLPTAKKGTTQWCVNTHPTKYFSDKKAFVLPGAFYGQCVMLMAEMGCSKADSISDADIVVFIGGEDINPALYGQADVASHFYQPRDDFEVNAYKKAQELGKTCLGICRGAQFLHAMNGGQLWQDVNNHAGRSHKIVDLDEDCWVVVTSMHHQMLQDNDTLEVIAVTEEQIATTFLDENLQINLNAVGSNTEYEIEIEAGVYHDTKCFFVQGHPEVGNMHYRTWFSSKLADLMYEWESTDIAKSIVNAIEVPTSKENK